MRLICRLGWHTWRVRYANKAKPGEEQKPHEYRCIDCWTRKDYP